MVKRLIIGVVLISTLSTICSAQSFYSLRRNRTLMFVAGTGTSTYFGELTNKGDYMDARPNLNVGLQYFISPMISTRLEATWFQLSGSDAKSDEEGRQNRNLSFLANNYEIALTGAINLFPVGNRYYQRPGFNAYFFAGIGFAYINPTTKLDGTKYALQSMMTEGVKYSKFQPVIPYGLGVKLKVGPFINVAVEGGYRMTFTDYLDDVSTVHPDKTGWDATRAALSDRRAELGLTPYNAGAIRGNPDTNDGYFLMNIKIEYYLPNNFLFKNNSKRIYKAKRRSIYRKGKSR